ncbi:hypothetical protein PUN28_020851 [Cardiocondyla obscurior]|uniref:Uncharacterized protein n=1 Tax=Cardiocondyla obscurior TaxID=286306 RepID=A0AAW2E998_9HYME
MNKKVSCRVKKCRALKNACIQDIQQIKSMIKSSKNKSYDEIQERSDISNDLVYEHVSNVIYRVFDSRCHARKI